MAPIKLEDKLKDKLENRSLTPSPNAWSTLADRLDKEEKKTGNTMFWWIGIAASVIGVILVTTQFYKSTESVKDLPIIVNTNASQKSDKESISEPVYKNEVVTNLEEHKEEAKVVNSTVITSASDSKTVEKSKFIEKEKTILPIEKPRNSIASLEPMKNITNDNSTVKTLTQEELKIIEVVDVIKQLQASESSVSNKEIDSLLKQAQREILKQRIFDETTRTVNAVALLQDVEVELEHSFRDKVFEALKSSYNSVKTAVAERRN